MAKLSAEQIRSLLAGIEQRLVAGERLTTHDIEAPIKEAGYHYSEAKRLIAKHGSVFLVGKYKESFGGMVPSELKNR